MLLLLRLRLLSGVLLLLLFAFDRCLAAGLHVVLGNPVVFSEHRGCEIGDGPGALWRVGVGSDRLVAEMARGVWTPTADYRDRVSPGATLGFNRTVFTDSGTYALICGRREVNVQLSVLIGVDVRLTGDTATFPCYASAAEGDSIRWDRSGDMVLEHRLSTGHTTVGVGFEGRVQLTAGGSGDGDWSLLIHNRPQDEGDYFCSVRRDGVLEAWGNPAAVKARHPRTTTQGPSTSSPPACPVCELPFIIVTVVQSALVVALVCILLWYKCRNQ